MYINFSAEDSSSNKALPFISNDNKSRSVLGRVVFIVDDEPRVLSAIQDSISSLGVEVVTFHKAQDCISVLKHRHCDLLITDLSMPEMDGISLLQAAKALKPLLPVILVTGYGDISTAVRAIKSGAIDFIEKPLDESTFLPLVLQRLRELPGEQIDASNLTPAERTILMHVAQGKTNREIASMLNRSLRTIENHRHNLMKKLGAESIADLIKIAMAMRLD